MTGELDITEARLTLHDSLGDLGEIQMLDFPGRVIPPHAPADKPEATHQPASGVIRHQVSGWAKPRAVRLLATEIAAVGQAHHARCCVTWRVEGVHLFSLDKWHECVEERRIVPPVRADLFSI